MGERRPRRARGRPHRGVRGAEGRRHHSSTRHRRNPGRHEGEYSAEEGDVERSEAERKFIMHHATCLTIGGLFLTTTVLLFGQALKIDFDKDQLGKPPAGWTSTQTGTGAAKWTVVQDDSAPSKPN